MWPDFEYRRAQSFLQKAPRFPFFFDTGVVGIDRLRVRLSARRTLRAARSRVVSGDAGEGGGGREGSAAPEEAWEQPWWDFIDARLVGWNPRRWAR